MKIISLEKLKKRISNILTFEFGRDNFATSYFFENLAAMLSSNVDLIDILEGMQADEKSKKHRQLIANVKKEVLAGSPLWRVAEKYKLVDEQYITLIRIGESTGNLPRSLNSITKQIQKEKEFRAKLTTAGLYPAFVVVLILGLGSFLVSFVLPRLSSVYDSLDVELPDITRLMVSIGDFFGNNYQIALPLFFASIFVSVYLLFVNKRTRFTGQYLILHTPVIGRLVREAETSRMGYQIYSLLESGINPNKAFAMLSKSSSLRAYKKLYNDISIYTNAGFSFRQIFQGYKYSGKYFPLDVRQMIITGERSGQLPENFLKVAKIYEKKNANTITQVGVLFEPFLLIVIWLVVAFIALSVILPLYSVIGNLSDISTTRPSSSSIEETENNITTDPSQIQ
jgi:type IV pilus assembly protein PilC